MSLRFDRGLLMWSASNVDLPANPTATNMKESENWVSIWINILLPSLNSVSASAYFLRNLKAEFSADCCCFFYIAVMLCLISFRLPSCGWCHLAECLVSNVWQMSLCRMCGFQHVADVILQNVWLPTCGWCNSTATHHVPDVMVQNVGGHHVHDVITQPMQCCCMRSLINVHQLHFKFTLILRDFPAAGNVCILSTTTF